MEKPLTIKTEELRSNIAKAINESSLHIQIVESVIKDFYNEVHAIYEKQAIQERNEYETYLVSNNTQSDEDKNIIDEKEAD